MLQRVQPTDILPLDSDELDRLSAKPDPMITWNPVSVGPSPGVLGFAREAQSIYLISWVLEMITADPPLDDVRRRSETQRLNELLQQFLLLVMNQAAGTWGIYCGAMNITIG